MTLTLTIPGAETLANGEPASLHLDRRGAVIGRSMHADWSLPDPRNHISSRHCEISFRDGVYILVDRSTNGTFVNGPGERLTAPYPIRDGDRITIGGFEIMAQMSHNGSDARSAGQPGAGSEPSSEWEGWTPTAAALTPVSGWVDAAAPATPADQWRSPSVTPPLPDGGGWDTPAPLSQPSVWSSEPREPGPPSAQDIWGQLADGNAIDWSRGDFGAPRPEPGAWGRVEGPRDEALVPISASPLAGDESGVTGETDPPLSAPATMLENVLATTAPDGWLAFLEEAGLPVDQIGSRPADVLAHAGAMLRQMVTGLVLMVDARARAKAQLGLQATSLELEGNNPLKFMRAPEQALLHLLQPPQRGFMGAARAVEDAYQDLQAHQMATLGAMRGALAEALARFSPAAIRERQAPRGWLSHLFPGAQDASLWQAYERDFEGVVRGADEAFMDVFAKEFRTAYEQQIADMKARRRAG